MATIKINGVERRGTEKDRWFLKFSKFAFRVSHPSPSEMVGRLKVFEKSARTVFGTNPAIFLQSGDSEKEADEEMLEQLFWGLYTFEVDIKPFFSILKENKISITLESDVIRLLMESVDLVGGLRVSKEYDNQQSGESSLKLLVDTAEKLDAIEKVKALYEDFKGANLPPSMTWLNVLPVSGLLHLAEHASEYRSYLNQYKSAKVNWITDIEDFSLEEIKRNARCLKEASSVDDVFNPDSFYKYIHEEDSSTDAEDSPDHGEGNDDEEIADRERMAKFAILNPNKSVLKELEEMSEMMLEEHKEWLKTEKEEESTDEDGSDDKEEKVRVRFMDYDDVSSDASESSDSESETAAPPAIKKRKISSSSDDE